MENNKQKDGEEDVEGELDGEKENLDGELDGEEEELDDEDELRRRTKWRRSNAL